MIRKLQRRFIRIALAVLALAVILVLAIVNLSNWISVRRELLDTVALIAGTHTDPAGFLSPDIDGFPSSVPPPPSDGTDETVPPPAGEEDAGSPSNQPDSRTVYRPDSMRFDFRQRLNNDRHARNLLNESSWFSVQETSDGCLSVRDAQRLSETEMTSDEQIALAEQALRSSSDSGFLHEYVYQIQSFGEGRVIHFLNCETRFAAVRTLLLISALASAGSILLAWLLVTLFSRKAVEPTLKNMEQQKRFITDASHELKTPITVISANMELLQMELPDNQWIRSTLKQTGTMRRLVDELVYLSRMEEENPSLTMEPLQLKPLLEEALEPFQAMAEFQGRDLHLTAEDGLWINGDRASIQRMISTLCDNAVKYASGEGEIRVAARGDFRSAVLVFSNPVAEPLSPEQCEHLFDRFYRADPSRNKGKAGGFGIGLAIAAAIAEKHDGHLSAAMSGTDRLIFTCVLPRTNAGRKGAAS